MYIEGLREEAWLTSSHSDGRYPPSWRARARYARFNGAVFLVLKTIMTIYHNVMLQGTMRG